MQVEGCTALVTGGQRGLGAAFVEELARRGAAKVYVRARNPVPTDDPRLVVVPLDVTDEHAVAALADTAPDVDLVINNAGVLHGAPLLTGDLADVVATFDANVLGALRVTRTLAPALAANGGGVLVNICSVLSWGTGAGSYGASKAALWSLSNSLRVELEPQGTQVTAVHLGFADTDMVRAFPGDKLAPADVARAVVDGVEQGADELLLDDLTRGIKAALSGPPSGLTFF